MVSCPLAHRRNLLQFADWFRACGDSGCLPANTWLAPFLLDLRTWAAVYGTCRYQAIDDFWVDTILRDHLIITWAGYFYLKQPSRQGFDCANIIASIVSIRWQKQMALSTANGVVVIQSDGINTVSSDQWDNSTSSTKQAIPTAHLSDTSKMGNRGFRSQPMIEEDLIDGAGRSSFSKGRWSLIE